MCSRSRSKRCRPIAVIGLCYDGCVSAVDRSPWSQRRRGDLVSASRKERTDDQAAGGSVESSWFCPSRLPRYERAHG